MAAGREVSACSRRSRPRESVAGCTCRGCSCCCCKYDEYCGFCGGHELAASSRAPMMSFADEDGCSCGASVVDMSTPRLWNARSRPVSRDVGGPRLPITHIRRCALCRRADWPLCVAQKPVKATRGSAAPRGAKPDLAFRYVIIQHVTCWAPAGPEGLTSSVQFSSRVGDIRGGSLSVGARGAGGPIITVLCWSGVGDIFRFENLVALPVHARAPRWEHGWEDIASPLQTCSYTDAHTGRQFIHDSHF